MSYRLAASLWGDEDNYPMGECRLLVEDERHKVRKPRKLNCGHEVKAGDTAYKTAYIFEDEFHAEEKCQKCIDEMYGIYTEQEYEAVLAEHKRDSQAISEQAQMEWERRTERHPSA